MEEAPRGLEIVTRYFSDFTPEQNRQLRALEEVYHEWNARINVISRKDIGSLYEKHVLHSLSIAAVFDFPPGTHVIDIGTGGGFPGIPLAIFFPETQFQLVDSIAKKLKVVDAVADALSLTNICTQHIRAEEIKGKKFDIAISRAVAPLKDLWFWSRPLLRPQNMHLVPENSDALPKASGLICLKGGDLHAEISESGTRPKIHEIYDLFPEESFREKYILQVPYQRNN
ncbi:MAG TPA: 16S rRNA (guanine(527)-N(7))-methyltransferase RsmG [Puia sp.]|jgi:16S rRNA (guanine527-N7)-methyltransferase|nr:16S rRNA (guanine(527)-N(7))-methyltransferase RsmG [Puia sp.]